MNDTATDAPEVLCGQIAAECICGSGAGHDGPHECECGGAWTGSEAAGDFRPVRFPDVSRVLGPTLGGLL